MEISVPLSGPKPRREGRALATDGTYLYLHVGEHLQKVGSGLQGSQLGKVYAEVVSFGGGEGLWLGILGDLLLFRSEGMEYRCRCGMSVDFESGTAPESARIARSVGGPSTMRRSVEGVSSDRR